MDLHNIMDDEVLYRAVLKTIPNGFINGRPTAALFMDPKGVSVDRDGARSENVIIDSFKYRFRKNSIFIAAVKISAGECRLIRTYPKAIGNTNNKYHAEIHDSIDIVEISLTKAVLLASRCMVVKG